MTSSPQDSNSIPEYFQRKIKEAKEQELKELDLSWNRYDINIQPLAYLADSIFELTQLEVLNLSNNRLINIPESIAKLSNLNGLYLNNNQITSLPRFIINLSNLTKLYLSNNQINKSTRIYC